MLSDSSGWLRQETIEEAFSPNDPSHAHELISGEKCAEILGVLQPKVIDHAKSTGNIQGMLDEAVCDPAMTVWSMYEHGS